jgi:hypothetical protein
MAWQTINRRNKLTTALQINDTIAIEFLVDSGQISNRLVLALSSGGKGCSMQ